MPDCTTNKNMPYAAFGPDVVYTVVSNSPNSPSQTSCIVSNKTLPVVALAESPTPTKTSTSTPTQTVTKTVTPTPATKTPTPTPTLTPSVTATNTRTPTVTPSLTRTKTATPTLTRTQTSTPSRSATVTPTNTASPTPTPSRGCLIGSTFNVYNLDATSLWTGLAYGNNAYSIIEQTNAVLHGSTLNNLTLGAGLPLSGPSFWNSIIFANNKFIAVGAAPLSAYSNDGNSWFAGNNMPTSESNNYTWNQIIFAGELGQYLAVPTSSNGSAPSKIAFSNDGISWTENTLPQLQDNVSNPNITKNYLTISYGNQIIVLGSNAKNEFINSANNYRASFLVSTNGGSVWTERQLPSLSGLSSTNYIGNIIKIVYGNQVFVALTKGMSSSSPCYRIYTSSNGINWTLRQTILGTDAEIAFGGINIYGDGKFVIMVNLLSNPLTYTTYHSDNGSWWYNANQTIGLNSTIVDSLFIENSLHILTMDQILASNSCLDGFGY
jgi:hypothetical protein